MAAACGGGRGANPARPRRAPGPVLGRGALRAGRLRDARARRPDRRHHRRRARRRQPQTPAAVLGADDERRRPRSERARPAGALGPGRDCHSAPACGDLRPSTGSPGARCDRGAGARDQSGLRRSPRRAHRRRRRHAGLVADGSSACVSRLARGRCAGRRPSSVARRRRLRARPADQGRSGAARGAGNRARRGGPRAVAGCPRLSVGVARRSGGPGPGSRLVRRARGGGPGLPGGGTRPRDRTDGGHSRAPPPPGVVLRPGAHVGPVPAVVLPAAAAVSGAAGAAGSSARAVRRNRRRESARGDLALPHQAGVVRRAVLPARGAGRGGRDRRARAGAGVRRRALGAASSDLDCRGPRGGRPAVGRGRPPGGTAGDLARGPAHPRRLVAAQGRPPRPPGGAAPHRAQRRLRRPLARLPADPRRARRHAALSLTRRPRSG